MRRPIILLVFFLILGLIPLGILGGKRVRNTWEELKRSDREHFISVATQVKQDIEDFHAHWLDALRLLRNLMENDALEADEKRSLLAQAMREMPDLAAIRISNADGAQAHVLIRDKLSSQMRNAFPDPAEALKLRTVPGNEDILFLPEVNLWLMGLSLPMKTNGVSGIFSARISLERIKKRIEKHLFTRTGSIFLLDSRGRKLFDSDYPVRTQHKMVSIARKKLGSGKHTLADDPIVEPYSRPSGEKMLSAYAFSKGFKLAVIVEKKEKDAYLAVRYLEQKLFNWMIYALPFLGLAVLISLLLLRAFLTMGRTTRRRPMEDMPSGVAKMLSEDNIRLIQLNQKFENTRKELRQCQAQLKKKDAEQ